MSSTIRMQGTWYDWPMAASVGDAGRLPSGARFVSTVFNPKEDLFLVRIYPRLQWAVKVDAVRQARGVQIGFAQPEMQSLC